MAAQLSVKDEFHALAQGLCEAIWINHMLVEIRLLCDCPIQLFCDKLVINIAHGSIQSDRMKYVEVDRHFIKKKFETKDLCTPYIPSGQ